VLSLAGHTNMEDDMKSYLETSEFIDWEQASIIRQAGMLAAGNELDAAKACFEFVRDEIKHSWDFQRNPVTCKASDVTAPDFKAFARLLYAFLVSSG